MSEAETPTLTSSGDIEQEQIIQAPLEAPKTTSKEVLSETAKVADKIDVLKVDVDEIGKIIDQIEGIKASQELPLGDEDEAKIVQAVADIPHANHFKTNEAMATLKSYGHAVVKPIYDAYVDGDITAADAMFHIDYWARPDDLPLVADISKIQQPYESQNTADYLTHTLVRLGLEGKQESAAATALIDLDEHIKSSSYLTAEEKDISRGFIFQGLQVLADPSGLKYLQEVESETGAKIPSLGNPEFMKEKYLVPSHYPSSVYSVYGFEEQAAESKDDYGITTKEGLQGVWGESVQEMRERFQELKSKVSVFQGEQKLTLDKLTKVGEQLGSNDGGWYEFPGGERYYLKFYKDPDQAKAEWVANQIYERLGIAVPETELIEIDGKLVFASKGVDVEPTFSTDNMRQAVEGGFVADAFLANWDVTGLNLDNLVKGADGKFYRIDNGGSLFFRAQGEKKDFVQDAVPELQSMRDPKYKAGEIFSHLSEDEIRQQARNLVLRITNTFIERTVRESDISAPGELMDILISRRDALTKMYLGNLKDEEAGKAFVETRERTRTVDPERRPLLPVSPELRRDSSSIEGHNVNIIDEGDLVSVNFKLTEAAYQKTLEHIKSSPYTYDQIRFKDVKRDGRTRFAAAVGVELDNDTFVYLANDSESRALLGYTRIEILSSVETPEELSQKVALAFEYLGLGDALRGPTEEDEKNYAIARYAWHHKVPLEEARQRIESGEVKLVREEVFPGYSTYVEKGKHKEYMEQGLIVLYHRITGDSDNIVKILGSDGLLSSLERYRRGAHVEGMSTRSDVESGGADSVFTRIITKRAQESSEFWLAPGRCALIIDPSVLDRTDWYAYPMDKYGSTAPDDMKFVRRNPEEIIGKLNTKYDFDNELMIRRGVPVRDIVGIAVGSYDDKTDLLNTLTEADIEEINGVPIGRFVYVAPTLDKLKTSGLERRAPES